MLFMTQSYESAVKTILSEQDLVAAKYARLDVAGIPQSQIQLVMKFISCGKLCRLHLMSLPCFDFHV